VTPAREPNGRALVGATEVIFAIITTFGVVAAAAIATLVPVLAAKNAAPVSTPSASAPADDRRGHAVPFGHRHHRHGHCLTDDRRRRPGRPPGEAPSPLVSPTGFSVVPVFPGRRLTDGAPLPHLLDDGEDPIRFLAGPARRTPDPGGEAARRPSGLIVPRPFARR
jgi:hypothetical protein